MNITVGFIGLGLIGGSIAKSLKKADSSIYIIAYNRSKEPLMQALSEGVIDESVFDVNDSFNKCDIIFLCTPVEYNSFYLSKVASVIKDGCIITDVGSVKGYIHTTVKELGLEHCFIGGHPMAGSEKTGYAASNSLLLENAYYPVTPTTMTTDEALNLYIKLIRLTGAIPIVLDPQTHDYAVAGISHVPHLIASSLVNLIKNNDTSDELMKSLAAGGFKDITRIASSSPEVWSQICMANPVQISLFLDKYISELTKIKGFIDSQNRDAISDMFADSREYRNSINITTKGPVLSNYELYCEIEDKEGALNSITHLLSVNHINIKNIEIIHNREYRDGALRVVFYDEHSYTGAYEKLQESGYKIYR